MNFMIVVNDNGELKSVPASNLPANLLRHLNLAINMALDIDSASEELVPKVVVGGISDEDSKRLRFLDALEAYGVESFEGYAAAREEAYPEETESDNEAEQEVA